MRRVRCRPRGGASTRRTWPVRCLRPGNELAPILSRASESPHLVTAVGHAHIDTAWLWPMRETRRKCARTFANQLRLLERYPEHRFACSQAVQYQWIKDGYPDAVRGRSRPGSPAGRWEPVGGMWVEPDTNVPSGESLVRQLVHGKRFFADEFGIENTRAVDPRRLRVLGGLAPDRRPGGGDRPCHPEDELERHQRLPPLDLLVGGPRRESGARPLPARQHLQRRLLRVRAGRSQRNFKDHGRSDRSLYPFGYGDGGGGPTQEMLERSRRLADLRGLPRVGSARLAPSWTGPRGASAWPPGWASSIWRPTGPR